MLRRKKEKREEVINQHVTAIQQYIADNYEAVTPPQPVSPVSIPDNGIRYSLKDEPAIKEKEAWEDDDDEWIPLDLFLDQVKNHTFVNKLSALIRQKGMRDPAVYKAANMDRRLFQKSCLITVTSHPRTR